RVARPTTASWRKAAQRRRREDGDKTASRGRDRNAGTCRTRSSSTSHCGGRVAAWRQCGDRSVLDDAEGLAKDSSLINRTRLTPFNRGAYDDFQKSSDRAH